jgi:1-acyl-sn-glycerol-3-phosphate acyltransferase
MVDMLQAYVVSPSKRIFRWLARPVFRGIFHVLSPVTVTGRENVPKSGAYIIVINHVSLYDSPFALAFWPVAPEVVGAVDIWQRRGQSTLATWYGGIPVHRGEYDRQAIQTLVAVLSSGRPLMIAPEGGRSHQLGMRRAQPGVGYLVEKACVPVVPVGIIGATDDYLQRALHWERPPLEMRIGEIVQLPPGEDQAASRRDDWQLTTDRIMAHVAALLPAEYKGVYAEQPGLVSQASQ